MNSHLFLFSEITEGPDKIIFYPQLNIWAYWGGEIEPGFVELQYDFGMEIKVCFNSFFTVDLKTDFERICKIIEFDLFHAFFNYKGDPNYLPYHWALYGNLKDQAKLVEDGQIVRKNDDLVHNSHCCAICGWCKYGDDDCPVLQGRLSGIICEDCAGEDDFPKNDLTKGKDVVR